LLAGTAGAAPLSWGELQRLPLPPAGQRIAYGSAPQQFGELRLPAGAGPFPVMVLIHGGCWQAAFDYVYMTRLGAWLAQQGMASWTIEYRRVGDAGGGWPGTFEDVAAAADALRNIAHEAPLDLTQAYAGGHSAGGQLALWLAARPKLPAASELHSAAPLPIRGVLGLAAITDMDTYRVGPHDSCHAAVDEVLGGTPASVAPRYAQTSPRRLLPLGVPQVFIQGTLDPIVTAASVHDYAQAATAAGDRVVELPLAGAGHFDTAVPIAVSEAALREALRVLTPSLK
jgi:acetyl esterase/lipase